MERRRYNRPASNKANNHGIGFVLVCTSRQTLRRRPLDLDMYNSPIQIRQLLPEDAELYRAIRLEALRDNPEAFGSTFEIENSQPLSAFADRLCVCDVLGAFCNSELLGIAGFMTQQRPNWAPCVLLISFHELSPCRLDVHGA